MQLIMRINFAIRKMFLSKFFYAAGLVISFRNITEIYSLTVVDLKRLEVHARDGPSDTNALAKWRILNRLHDRNETMYYKASL